MRLWGYNIEGKSVFIPKYITALPIPPSFSVKDPGIGLSDKPIGIGKLDLEDDLYQKCARFVSLIPLKGESEYFKDMPDIFMTCQQFLDMRAGDFEEHAILLCNYFLYIDHVLKKNTQVESMVIMGRGVPKVKPIMSSGKILPSTSTSFGIQSPAMCTYSSTNSLFLRYYASDTTRAVAKCLPVKFI